MALTVAATSAIYLWTSTYFLNKQAELQRTSRNIQQKESQLMYDTVGGWSSVSYFNRHAYEKGRYAAAVGPYLRSIKVLRTAILTKLHLRSNFTVGAEARIYLLLHLVWRRPSPAAWVLHRWHPGYLPDRRRCSESWQLCLFDVCTTDGL